MAKRDYYEVLGLSKGADEKQIKNAYRQMAKKYHPDLNPNDKEAEQKFKEVNEAYEVLSNPEKKAKYDQFGHAAFEQGGGGYGQGGFQGGFDFNDFGFGDIFSNFFQGGGGGNSRRGGPVDGEDINVKIVLTFEEAVFGCKKDVTYNKVGKCESCSGTGAEPGTTVEKCSRCGGVGTIRVQKNVFGMSMTSQSTCPDCGGKGKKITTPCAKCHGQGNVTTKKTLGVNIPAGIDDGQYVALRGQGHSGRNGGYPGDLNVYVSVRKSQIFERDGYDLYCEVPITFAEATLGGTIKIPTVDGGEVEYTIPEGTQTGTRVTIKRQGVVNPNYRDERRGNLYADVVVETPKNLNSQQKDLLRKFAESCGEKNFTKRTSFFKKK